jgi:uncharacterized protein
MNEAIYRQWYFERPALAHSILSLLTAGTGDPVALVGERRIGKTSLVLNELIPAAAAQGFVPVYIDLFQQRARPLTAINYALQEAIDELEVPASTVGKRLRTNVKKIGLVGASIELGAEPARRRPEDPYLLVDWLMKTLVRVANKPILALFDEIQELAGTREGENIVSAVRSAITKSKAGVRVVFTGSSQGKLLELFSRSRAALYEGASTLAFPYLGDDFLAFVARRSKERFKKALVFGDLQQAFVRCHHQPRALIDLVLFYASSDARSLLDLMDEQTDVQLAGAHYGELWSGLKPLQQMICLRIVHGQDLTSLAARHSYGRADRGGLISPGVVGRALRALVNAYILTKREVGRGVYHLDDPLFAQWIRRKSGDVVS